MPGPRLAGRNWIYWGVATAVLLAVSQYWLIERVSILLVGTFTLMTVLAVILLQMDPTWAISSSELLSGVIPSVPPETGGRSPLTTALAALGIIGVGASELMFYPYWCLEKGYATAIGPRNESQAWTTRARDGRPFLLLKFRSMREATGPDGTPLPDAERLTGFGRFLRRTSLDELPQLFCVLTGTMSLVGPRPLPERYVARYSPRQASRLFVRPGLTGWAQTHGRNAVDWDKRLSLDADYVTMLGRPFGLLLDLRIIAATAGQVLLQAVTGRGVSAPGHATMQEFLDDQPQDAVE